MQVISRFVALSTATIALCAVSISIQAVSASDWPRFRGPDGTGISPDSQPLPEKWSADENIKWKLKLPGPGSSCPIVVGNKVFVTCWSGYGLKGDEGDEKDLRRHLVCVDRDTGHIIWDKVVEPVLPEDPYDKMLTQHGYASHTPASDGQRVYVFFGKTGVLAFDLDGNKLWQTSVGTDSGENGWGTASSPILYKDLVIVPATSESKALVALDKKTGKKVWRVADEGFAMTWGTPTLVDCGDGRTDLVMGVPYHIWAFDPETGKRRWSCEGLGSNSMCSSVILGERVNGEKVGDKLVIAMETGPRGGGTMAVKVGGEGDVSKTNVVWRGSDRSRIETPIYYDGKIYFVANRSAVCLDATTGKVISQNNLGGGAAQAGGGGQRGGPGAGRRGGSGAGGGGGGRGGMTSSDYASPVMAQGKIYYVARNGQAYVYSAGPDFKLLATNRFPDEADFSSTPAISDGALFVRSSKFLYCVASTKTD